MNTNYRRLGFHAHSFAFLSPELFFWAKCLLRVLRHLCLNSHRHHYETKHMMYVRMRVWEKKRGWKDQLVYIAYRNLLQWCSYKCRLLKDAVAMTNGQVLRSLRDGRNYSSCLEEEKMRKIRNQYFERLWDVSIIVDLPCESSLADSGS